MLGASAAKLCPFRITFPFGDICGDGSLGRGALFRSPAMGRDNTRSNAFVRFSADASARGRDVRKQERKHKSRRREAGRREEHRRKTKKRKKHRRKEETREKKRQHTKDILAEMKSQQETRAVVARRSNV